MAKQNENATMDLSKTEAARLSASPTPGDRSNEGMTAAEIKALGRPKAKPAADVDPNAELTKPKPLTADELSRKRVDSSVEKIEGRTIVEDVLRTKGGPVLRHTYMDTRKA